MSRFGIVVMQAVWAVAVAASITVVTIAAVEEYGAWGLLTLLLLAVVGGLVWFELREGPNE